MLSMHYQKQAVEFSLKTKHSHILAAPCGAGKTEIAVGIIKALPTKRVLVVAHMVSLTSNVHARLARYEIHAGELYAGKAPTKSLVQVASIQTLQALAKRGDRLPRFELIIVDECHWMEQPRYRWLARQYPKAKFVGLSATPWDANGQPLNTVYKQIHSVVRHSELLGLRLVKPDIYTVAYHKLKLRKNASGEYTDQAVAAAYKKQPAARKRKFAGNMLKEWRKHAINLRTLVFCSSIEQARETAALFEKAGVRAAAFSSDDSIEHNTTVEAAFRAGSVQVLCNVAKVTEGWDLPELECVVLARPVGSYRLYIQMCGRVMRTHPGKSRAVLIDCYGAYNRFGNPEVDVDFTAPLREYETVEGDRVRKPGGARQASDVDTVLLAKAEEEKRYQITQAQREARKNLITRTQSIRDAVAAHLKASEQILTPEQIADRLGLPVSTIHQWTFKLRKSADYTPKMDARAKFTAEQWLNARPQLLAYIRHPKDSELSLQLGLHQSAISAIRHGYASLDGLGTGLAGRASPIRKKA
jgi:DNA repair protein RadD